MMLDDSDQIEDTFPQATPEKKKRWPQIVLFLILLVLVFNMGFYTIQPIGAVPDGRTLLVWRASGEPFFNSADGECLRRQGYVNLLCRALMFGEAPVDRIILRLPYMRWTYLLSTDGAEFSQ